MPRFSTTSVTRLRTCHSDLQRVLNDAIEIVDFAVVCGYRGEEAQRKAFESGASKLTWPNSKHNRLPSLAVDVVPTPRGSVYTKDVAYFLLAGVILACAHFAGVNLRWGGDWNRNFVFDDQTFNDYGHFELVEA